jgi:hypothetical protein
MEAPGPRTRGRARILDELQSADPESIREGSAKNHEGNEVTASRASDANSRYAIGQGAASRTSRHLFDYTRLLERPDLGAERFFCARVADSHQIIELTCPIGVNHVDFPMSEPSPVSGQFRKC